MSKVDIFIHEAYKHLQGRHNQKLHGNRYASVGGNITYQGIKYRVTDIYSHTNGGPKFAQLQSENGSYQNVPLSELRMSERSAATRQAKGIDPAIEKMVGERRGSFTESGKKLFAEVASSIYQTGKYKYQGKWKRVPGGKVSRESAIHIAENLDDRGYEPSKTPGGAGINRYMKP